MKRIESLIPLLLAIGPRKVQVLRKASDVYGGEDEQGYIGTIASLA